MTGKVALLGFVLLFVFIAGIFYLQLTGGPTRTQNLRLDPHGDISVHLETKPDPPKMGGIPLILHITDKDGKPVALDKVHYEYDFQERGGRALDGEKMGDGTFQAVASLDEVGDWDIRVTLFSGSRQTQVRFVLRVGANI